MENTSDQGAMNGSSAQFNVFRLSRHSVDLLLVTVLVNILALALPLTLMQVYDRILVNQAIDTLVWLIVGCVVALSLEATLRITRAFISGYMAARFEHAAGCEAVDRLLNSRLEEFERDELGTQLDRLNAVSTLRGFYAGQPFQILMDFPFALLFLVAVGYLGGAIVLVPLGVILVFFATVFYFRRYFEYARSQQIDISDRRISFIVEILNRIHAVKAISMEEQLLRRHEKLQAESAEVNMSVSFWNILPSNLGAMFSQITIFGVIGIGAGRVTDGTLTLGALTACSLLSARAMQPIQNLAGFLLRFSEARIAQSRFNKILTLAREVPEGRPPFPEDITGIIEMRDVSFRYGDDLPYVLQNVSLTMAARSMIGIHGTSLSGTTTLLYLTMGILKPESGTVLIDAFNLAGWDHTDLKGRVEYLPQSATLFGGTLLDNIALFDPSKHGAARDAASVVDLDALVASLPMGYETRVNSQSNDLLPSGLIQRVAIARALVVRPRILLLDKTDSAMDRDSQLLFRWLIEQLKGTCTIVMVTNQPSILTLADEVYEIAGGRLEQSGSPTLLSQMKNP